jgi:hypothetical protein
MIVKSGGLHNVYYLQILSTERSMPKIIRNSMQIQHANCSMPSFLYSVTLTHVTS